MPQSAIGSKTEAQSEAERMSEEKIGLKLSEEVMSFSPFLDKGRDDEWERQVWYLDVPDGNE